MKKNKIIFIFALLTLVFCLIQFLAGKASAKEVSEFRGYFYKKAGEWLYEGLSKIRIPHPRRLTRRERPFILHVDWARQARANKRGFPLAAPCAVDFKANSPAATAVYAGFRVKYHAGGKKYFKRFLARVKGFKGLGPRGKKLLLDNGGLMRERAMVFYLSFDQAQARCLYYPGKIQFKGGDRTHMGEWLPMATREERNGGKTDYALIQDSTGLLGILNGIFDRVDNVVNWGVPEKQMRYAGFRFDSRTFLPPQPEMATFTLYQDGHMALGTYRKLPDKKKIKTFVQNRFMVVENGKPGPDEYPNAFCSFYDDVARSYLFTDKHHRFGVIWTLYTPPSVLAALSREMGIKNMMLLDIHAPIAASFADPAGPYQFKSYKDYVKRSFDLIPNFYRLDAIRSSLAWISKAVNSGIQTNYPAEAFSNGEAGYFAVFLRGSPETQKASSPQPTVTPTPSWVDIDLGNI